MGAKIVETFSLPSFYDNFNDGQVAENNFKNEIQDKVIKYSKELYE